MSQKRKEKETKALFLTESTTHENERKALVENNLHRDVSI